MANYPISNNDIVITGIGMVTSLGHDVASSCAAYRAGLSGAKELEGYIVFNENLREFQNPIVHQISIITGGFEGFSRLLRIGTLALENMFSYNDIRTFDCSKVGLYLSLPDFCRIYVDIFTELNEPATKSKNIFNVSHQNKKNAISLGHKLCARLTELASCPVPEQNWYTIDTGHAGVISAIEKAMGDIAEGKIDRCLVGGIDSFLDIQTLDWLQKNQRLKTEENPLGFQPSEAGAFLLLEKLGSDPKTKTDILAILSATATSFEPDHLFTGKPALGRGLTKSVLDLIKKRGSKEVKLEWIISDQNGEYYRAQEWGHALLQLSIHYPDLKTASLWYPATSFGDTGAASGAVSICSAIRSFMHNYAVTSDAIIISSSDQGERAALYLTRVPL